MQQSLWSGPWQAYRKCLKFNYSRSFLRQLATQNMLLLGLALLPLYLLALGLLLLFYQKFHVWKKEGVSVGFVYDTSPVVKQRPSVCLYVFDKICCNLFLGGSNSLEERVCWQLDISCT